MKVHHFESTRDAYDASQCDEDVSTGDILIIASEQVVGISYTWPFAVTKEAGGLHGVLVDDEEGRKFWKSFSESIAQAKAIALENGWETIHA